MSDIETLLADLEEGEQKNIHTRDCQACVALRDVPEEAYDALRRALAGTIGDERLSKILSKNGFNVGRRAIIRHRREEHTA